MERTFGAELRRLRMQKQIGLRVFAQKLGVSATYISKIERDEFKPPAEDKVRAMALLLNQDPDEFLALAKRLPNEAKEILKARPVAMGILLRAANRLQDDQLKEFVKRLERRENESE